MDNLRTQIVNFGNAKDGDESFLDPLAIYHRHILSLEARLPLGAKSVNMKFAWGDTLSRGKTSDYSWGLEKLSIMFNIGAVYS
jgi:hypothetical protein